MRIYNIITFLGPLYTIGICILYTIKNLYVYAMCTTIIVRCYVIVYCFGFSIELPK